MPTSLASARIGTSDQRSVKLENFERERRGVKRRFGGAPVERASSARRRAALSPRRASAAPAPLRRRRRPSSSRRRASFSSPRRPIGARNETLNRRRLDASDHRDECGGDCAGQRRGAAAARTPASLEARRSRYVVERFHAPVSGWVRRVGCEKPASLFHLCRSC